MLGLFGRQKRERPAEAAPAPLLRPEAELGGRGLEGQQAGLGSSSSKRRRADMSNAAAAVPPPPSECQVCHPGSAAENDRRGSRCITHWRR